MMSRIDRIRQTLSARKAARTAEARADEARDAVASGTNLPIAVEPPARPRGVKDDRRPGESEFDAQLMGQDGQRRGLRAGPSIFDIARAAYTRIEWSGRYDRRAGKGRRARTDI